MRKDRNTRFSIASSIHSCLHITIPAFARQPRRTTSTAHNASSSLPPFLPPFTCARQWKPPMPSPVHIGLRLTPTHPARSRACDRRGRGPLLPEKGREGGREGGKEERGKWYVNVCLHASYFLTLRRSKECYLIHPSLLLQLRPSLPPSPSSCPSPTQSRNTCWSDSRPHAPEATPPWPRGREGGRAGGRQGSRMPRHAAGG